MSSMYGMVGTYVSSTMPSSTPAPNTARPAGAPTGPIPLTGTPALPTPGAVKYNPGLFGATTTGSSGGATRWDTSLDANVGNLDAQIKAMDAVKGTSAFDQTKYNALVTQRSAANEARWKSVMAGASPGPGFQALQQALQRGDISLDDLAGVDISTVSNDGALAKTVDSIIASKKAAQIVPPPAAPAPVDPTVQEQADANSAVDDTMSSVTDYIKGQQGDLNTFDKGLQGTENQEASTGANLARQFGAEGAGMAAGQTEANTAAQGSAQRDVLQQGQTTDLNKFLSDSLEKDIGDNSNLASLDVAKRTQIQSQAADHLMDTIKQSVGTTDAAAQGQLNDLAAAIDNWKAHMEDQAQSQANWMKVIKIVGGLAMTGAGVAITAGTAGAASPLGAGLIAGGVGTTINGASS